MDNEVSICCFYAVIRNCHTPFHFLVSLGLFACMRLSLEQNCKHQTGTQLKFEAVTRGLLPPHGQEASGRYCDGPGHSSAAASCSLTYLSASAEFSFPCWSSGHSRGVNLVHSFVSNRCKEFNLLTSMYVQWVLAPHSLRFLWKSLHSFSGERQCSSSQFSSWMQKIAHMFLTRFSSSLVAIPLYILINRWFT